MNRSYLTPCVVLAAAGILALSGCQTTTTETSTTFSVDTPKPDSILDSKLKKLSEDAEKYPLRHDLQYQIAAVQFEKTNYRDSAVALEKAIALAPDDSKYHYRLGQVYLRMEELDRAENHFRKMVGLLPDARYTGAYAALGYVCSRKKDYKGAVEAFEKCVEIEPENPIFYYSLGAQYDMLGDKKGAIRNFQEYLVRGGTEYRKNAIFYLEKLGVSTSQLPPSSSDRNHLERGLPVGEDAARGRKSGAAEGSLPGFPEGFEAPAPKPGERKSESSAAGRDESAMEALEPRDEMPEDETPDAVEEDAED